MSIPPPPPPFFSSLTPGSSVVLPDTPSIRRALIPLFVVGCLALAALVGGAVVLASHSADVSPFVDSQAGVTSTSTTNAVALAPGEVRFLTTQSPISHVDYEIDFVGVLEETCFNLRPGDIVIERRGCDTEHFFQFYARGEVPLDITEYSKVDQFTLEYCEAEFVDFVDVSTSESRFRIEARSPDLAYWPDYRFLNCFIFVDGDLGWIGSARHSGVTSA